MVRHILTLPFAPLQATARGVISLFPISKNHISYISAEGLFVPATACSPVSPTAPSERMDQLMGSGWIIEQEKRARECKFCKMRMEEVKSIRNQFDSYEKSVREEHLAMVRELKACKYVLGIRDLEHFVEKRLIEEYPDIYGKQKEESTVMEDPNNMYAAMEMAVE